MENKKQIPKPKKKAVKKKVKGKAKPKDKGGRPLKYLPSMNKIVYRLALLGAKNTQIADSLGITYATLCNWQKIYKGLFDSLRKGREDADSEVAISLFKSANGFTTNETDIRTIDGQIVQTRIKKNFAPNATSMIFWLTNKQPDLWKQKQQVLQSGEIGIKVEEIAPKLDALSDEEQIQWLALQKKLRK